MSEKFTVEIITPGNSIIKTEAGEVVLPAYEGEIGILKNHVSLITFLRPGFIKIINESKKIFFVEEGTVEFVNNNLLVLSSTVTELAKINNNLVESMIKDAEKNISNIQTTDKEKYLLSYKIDALKSINK